MATVQQLHDRLVDVVDALDDEVRKNAAAIAGKVDAVTGKGLSTNDYTANEKTKLAGIEAGANNYVLPTATTSTIGGVKVGNGLSVAADGTVSVNQYVNFVNSGTDLNTLNSNENKTYGSPFMLSEMSNAPVITDVGEGFRLENKTFGNGTVVQVLYACISTGGLAIYTRIYNSPIWSAWKQVSLI